MPAGLPLSERISLNNASLDPAFCAITSWISEFLCSPHPELGRTGDVCPFAKVAVAKDTIALFRNISADEESFERDVEMHLGDFETNDQSDIYNARIIMPAGLKDAAATIERVQRRLKSAAVQKHLMLGQFYRKCVEPGLWNPHFRPLQAPVPFIAIRRMVLTDIAFLHMDDSLLRIYLEKFGSRGTTALSQLEETRTTKNAVRIP